MSCQGLHTWKVPESELRLRFLASIVVQFSPSTTQFRPKSINCCGHTTFPMLSSILSSQVRNFLPFFPELETAGNQAACILYIPLSSSVSGRQSRVLPTIMRLLEGIHSFKCTEPPSWTTYQEVVIHWINTTLAPTQGSWSEVTSLSKGHTFTK